MNSPVIIAEVSVAPSGESFRNTFFFLRMLQSFYRRYLQNTTNNVMGTRPDHDKTRYEAYSVKVVHKVTRMHHRQCSFKKNSGGGPPNPRQKCHLKSLWASHMPATLLLLPCAPEQPLSPLTLDSVRSSLMLSMIHMFVFLSIHDTLSTLLQHHNSKASIFLLSCFLIVQVSSPYRTIGKTKTFISFTFVSSVTPLSFHIDVSPPIAAFPWDSYSSSHFILA